ncbi:MAG: hypothetical protein LBT92_00905 [Rickettsiales bacterium]|jgi:hypothetical protein|nr:hypothetical protein [Rickettsiales bacterium]
MDSKNLSVLSYSNGFTLWHYKTDDDRAAVMGPGYFSVMAGVFNPGDAMFVTYCGGRRRFSELAVMDGSGGEVTLVGMR